MIEQVVDVFGEIVDAGMNWVKIKDPSGAIHTMDLSSYEGSSGSIASLAAMASSIDENENAVPGGVLSQKDLDDPAKLTEILSNSKKRPPYLQITTTGLWSRDFAARLAPQQAPR